ncbi:MAG: 50S ribosomal protein L25/general stress protein Ctc [Oleispira antarctica]|uniref:Large ribosomal subunit protein bL25 n=1 Tax=Oleispira antarctica RB-8 TaxID=698738 RepID=R4YNE8_OLEAN|nr:50S ribosomal protein L25/general stress protein Ctc [Oleispira antarctica]MBQ0792437.1 50S ribosomal protein L25/general stress protein Ctc [Oleispira antarctica]CCK74653.1 50S ribosomal protein L25 (General stress protein CTC) [Oleispira antarctica RB-8]|tara:strand:+ start:4991 stop:5629 length:639 start_codon:yes stop_codon:yes gene_type:complete
MSELTLNAELREVVGKGASRRLRRLEGLVPAIIYGGKTGGNARKPTNITMKSNELKKALENEAYYSSIITLNIGDKTEQVVLKDMQRHPAREHVMHADFLRVSKTTILKSSLPIHFINEDICEAVKTGGAKINHQMASIDVICAAGDLPEYIEIDLANAEVDSVIHLSDITFPKGVESLALSHGPDHDTAVVSLFTPKGIVEDDAEEEAAAE